MFPSCFPNIPIEVLLNYSFINSVANVTTTKDLSKIYLMDPQSEV